MNFIHVGLGKTATTTLQRIIFPLIEKIRPNVNFNKNNLYEDINRYLKFEENEVLNKIIETVKNGEHLISNENLCNWNPREWVRSAEKVLSIFGRDCHIIITVRDTEEYLRSIYQQTIQEGYINSPKDFFLRSKQFDKFQNNTSKNFLNYFDVDSFNLENLYKIYQTRFKKVSIVPLQNINKLKFLIDHYRIKESELNYIKKQLKLEKKQNKSYGRIAMKITEYRNKFLFSFGLRPITSEDILTLEYKKELPVNKINDLNKKFEDLPLSKKITQLRYRIILQFKWNNIMMKFINKYLPYIKYHLPNDTYKNQELIKLNREFIEKFLD